MNDPAQINKRALKSAWVIMWKNANWGILNPILVIIIPSWLKVDRAMIFFISHSEIALKPAIVIVHTAINKMIILKYWDEWRNG